MALGDLMASRYSSSSVSLSSNHLDHYDDGDSVSQTRDSEIVSSSSYVNNINNAVVATTSMAYLPETVVLRQLRHEAFEACVPCGPSESGLVSKWRPKDRESLETLQPKSCPNHPN